MAGGDGEFSAFVHFENVPRITSQGADILKRIKQLLERYGYVVDMRADHNLWELANINRLKEPIPVRGRQGLWNWEPPDDWKCVVCNGFVVGGGLCEDCIGQETEIAMDLGLI